MCLSCVSYFLSCIMAVESLFVSVMCELLFVLYHGCGVAFCVCICQGGVVASEVIVLYHGCGVAFCVCICQGGVAASEVIVVKESVDQSLTHPAAGSQVFDCSCDWHQVSDCSCDWHPTRYLTVAVTGTHTRYLTVAVTGTHTRYLTVAVTGTQPGI